MVSARGPGRPRGSSHDEIRDVALRLFAERGYAATSLAEIAAAAGISRTTLFAYFPAKRDLIWEDFDRRTTAAARVFVDEPADRPLVDVIVTSMLVNSSYSPAEHAALAQRRRIVERDDELRAYVALATQELTSRLAESARRRAPAVDAGLVDLVTRALVAAAAGCTEDWALDQSPTISLDTYTSQRLDPIVTVLRPLLRETTSDDGSLCFGCRVEERNRRAAKKEKEEEDEGVNISGPLR